MQAQDGKSQVGRGLIKTMPGQPISRVLSRAKCPWAVIYLGRTLPPASCSLPGTQTARAAPCSCLTLLPMGFAWPRLSPDTPVRSYRTVSPSPPKRQYPSLLHFSVGFPRLAVSQHRALWSADFPQTGQTPIRDRPASPASSCTVSITGQYRIGKRRKDKPPRSGAGGVVGRAARLFFSLPV